MRYAVVMEKADANYSAYVPDLPGCIATAGSEATRHDRVVKLWAAIAGNAMLWGWIAVLISIGP